MPLVGSFGWTEFKFVIILLFLIFISTLPVAFLGINWSDSAQIFYFGNKILQGNFPYRDFAYQTGFLPICADAFFQRLFGATYLSSVLLGVVLKIATLIVTYLLLMQRSSRFFALAITGGLSFLFFDLVDGGNEYWANFFIVLSAYFASKRASNLILSGVALALVLTARQTNGSVCVILLSIIWLFQSFFIKNQKIAQSFKTIFFGALLGYLIIAGFLILNQSIGAAIYELFVAAGEKKNFNPFFAVADAFLGGTLFTASLPKTIIKTLLCNFIPFCLILWSLVLDGFFTNRSSSQNPHSPKILIWISILMTAGFLLPEIQRAVLFRDYVWLKNFSDVLAYDFPRVFFTTILFLALFMPRRTENFFGMPTFSILLFSILILGSVWAMQMSWMGRGYVKTRLLVTFVWVFVALSNQISELWKKNLAKVFLCISIATFALQMMTHSAGQEGLQFGFYKSHRYELGHPMAEGIKVSREKLNLYSELKKEIKPGDTCFIYGSAPILYLMLECKNPSNLDIAYPDSLTSKSAQKAIAHLNTNPPKWIIETGQSRYLSDEPPKSISEVSGPSDQPGPKMLRRAMQSLISRYQIILEPTRPVNSKRVFGVGDLDHVFDYKLFKRK